MKKIIFLCHGNICRSPMAEYVMKDLVRKAGLSDEFEITSGAVSDEEWGNPIYPPAQRKLREKGIPFGHHSAHKISPAEFAAQDLVVVMDHSNLRWLSRIVPDHADVPAGPGISGHPNGPSGSISGITKKVHLMMSFAGEARDVADPWYTGDFEKTYQDVLAGCSALLEMLK